MIETGWHKRPQYRWLVDEEAAQRRRDKELARALLIIFFTTLITCWVIYALPS